MKSNSKYTLLILSLFAFFFAAFAQQVYGDEKNGKAVSGINDQRVIIYYFHGKFRCQTCKRIEHLTKEAIVESFANEIKSGLVEVKVINVEEKGNSHFSKDYQLFTRSVVVSDTEKGKEKRWKNLQRVWELVHSEKAFKKYIRDEIKAYIS